MASGISESCALMSWSGRLCWRHQRDRDVNKAGSLKAKVKSLKAKAKSLKAKSLKAKSLKAKSLKAKAKSLKVKARSLKAKTKARDQGYSQIQ